METKIKVSTEITEPLQDVKPGDVVKSINHGGIILVTETNGSRGSFNGLYWIEEIMRIGTKKTTDAVL